MRYPPANIVIITAGMNRIAIKTKHSNEAVDRYIRDYLRVKLLWENQITNIDQICQLVRLSKRVVN